MTGMADLDPCIFRCDPRIKSYVGGAAFLQAAADYLERLGCGDNGGMQLDRKDRLFVLTGAGVSAESGLATFRGSGGLWDGYRVEQVATPEAWRSDSALVWRFYSQRRRDALRAQPNTAHFALADAEKMLDDNFYLC